MFKRLIIIGGCAVGGSIGSLVFKTGFPVVLIARGEHGQKIRTDGFNNSTTQSIRAGSPAMF